MFAVLSTCACSAFAQWQWVGEDGRKVFSDRPPPMHIAPQLILKRPHGVPAAPLSPAPAAETAPDGAVDDAQAEQEAARKETEALEQAQDAAKLKAQAEQEKKAAAQLALQRQTNCQQAQATQRTLQSGRMLAHTNEKGEHGFLSDAQRQQQLQRAQAVIKSDCGGNARKQRTTP